MLRTLRLRARWPETISSPSSPTHTQLSCGDPSGFTVARCARASDSMTSRALSGRPATPATLSQRHAPRRHGRRLDDRRRRLPERKEPVDHLLEVLDVADVELHEEAVLPRDAVALDHLGAVAPRPGDLRQLARPGAHAQHHPHRKPERARV